MTPSIVLEDNTEMCVNVSEYVGILFRSVHKCQETSNVIHFYPWGSAAIAAASDTP